MDLPLLLRSSLNNHLSRSLGFLPRRVPADRLPDAWSPWMKAGEEVAERFHGLGARDWLAELFATPFPRAEEAVAELSEHEADRLLTVVSVLGHAVRWDRLPPSPEEMIRTALVLPPGIADLWRALCLRNGHPRVGNLASLVTTNWRLPGRSGGDEYAADDLLEGAAQPAVLWLVPPKDEALRAFLRTGIETEAIGARVVLSAVRLVEAAAAKNEHRCGWLLERLHGELSAIGKPFRQYVQKQQFSGADFMTLIQPATLWGLDEGDGVLEGASGPQLGALQVADSLLGISRASPMGQSILHTRRFLPKRHRAFLEIMDLAGPRVRAFVVATRDRQLAGLFNACGSALKAWRLVHQKRGAMYLRSDGTGTAPAYASTGGVVALGDERVERFEAAMVQRVEETDAAAIPIAPEAGTPRPLRHLTDDDAQTMNAAAWQRNFADGGVIVSANTRGTGLFIVRAGAARVCGPAGEPIADLLVGEVFGELSYLDNEPTSAAVIAVGETIVDVVPREHLHVLCESRPGFAERFHLSIAVLLAERMRRMNTRVG